MAVVFALPGYPEIQERWAASLAGVALMEGATAGASGLAIVLGAHAKHQSRGRIVLNRDQQEALLEVLEVIAGDDRVVVLPTELNELRDALELKVGNA